LGSVARWAGVAAVVAVCAACTTKVTTAIVTGPKVERRIPIEAGAIGSSTWRWDGQGLPVLVAGAGLALAVAGFATYDFDGVERECNDAIDLCYANS
jgi:hypothetical protein